MSRRELLDNCRTKVLFGLKVSELLSGAKYLRYLFSLKLVFVLGYRIKENMNFKDSVLDNSSPFETYISLNYCNLV